MRPTYRRGHPLPLRRPHRSLLLSPPPRPPHGPWCAGFPRCLQPCGSPSPLQPCPPAVPAAPGCPPAAAAVTLRTLASSRLPVVPRPSLRLAVPPPPQCPPETWHATHSHHPTAASRGAPPPPLRRRCPRPSLPSAPG